PARVPLGNPGREMRVEAVTVGLPDVDPRTGQRRAVRTARLAAEHQRCAGLVGAHRQRDPAFSPRRTGVVERARDRALAPGPLRGRDVLHRVFDEHVEEQRPLAVLAHLTFQTGRTSVAAAIVAPDGSPPGGLSVAGPTSTFPLSRISTIA